MLSVADKPYMLIVFMLNVIMRCAVMMGVGNKPFMHSVVFLNVVYAERGL
jgi:hypothetical protein